MTTHRSISAPGRGRAADRHHREVVDAEQAQRLPRRECWAACAGGGTPARPRSHGSATWPRSCAATRSAPSSGHLPVVEAVRQDDDVRGEPVAAQVAALPDVGGARRRQRSGQRSPAQRAAGVVAAVRADQVDRPVRAGSPTDPSQGASSRSASVDAHRPPDALAARAAVGVGPPPARVGQPLPGRRTSSSRTFSARDRRASAGATVPVEARLGQRVAPPRAGLLDQHPAPGRGRRRDGGVPARQGPHRAPVLVQPAQRPDRDGGTVGGEPPVTPPTGSSVAPVRVPTTPIVPGGRIGTAGDRGDRVGDQSAGQRHPVVGIQPGQVAHLELARGQQLGQRVAHRAGERVRAPPGQQARPGRRRRRGARSAAGGASAAPSPRSAPRPRRPGPAAPPARGAPAPRSAPAAGRPPRPGRPGPSQSRSPASTCPMSSSRVVGVGEVHAEREGAAQLRVVRGERSHQVQRGLGRGPAGHRVDADGQVRADLARAPSPSAGSRAGR